MDRFTINRHMSNLSGSYNSPPLRMRISKISSIASLFTHSNNDGPSNDDEQCCAEKRLPAPSSVVFALPCPFPLPLWCKNSAAEPESEEEQAAFPPDESISRPPPFPSSSSSVNMASRHRLSTYAEEDDEELGRWYEESVLFCDGSW